MGVSNTPIPVAILLAYANIPSERIFRIVGWARDKDDLVRFFIAKANVAQRGYFGGLYRVIRYLVDSSS